jgi:hypothetical protein
LVGIIMQASPDLLLSNHVHACVADQYLVFLDLKRNEYSCLDRASTRTLCGRLAGLSLTPDSAGGADGPDVPADLDALVQSLSARELLTTDVSRGHSVGVARSLDARADMTRNLNASSICTARYIPSVLLSCWLTARKLRHQPIQQIVEGVRSKRKRAAPGDVRSRAAIAELVVAFGAARRLSPQRPVCLFDSLALAEFLAMNEFFPSLVFGVRMNPFSAHCWLQDAQTVLNDVIDNTSTYAPILIA